MRKIEPPAKIPHFGDALMHLHGRVVTNSNSHSWCLWSLAFSVPALFALDPFYCPIFLEASY